MSLKRQGRAIRRDADGYVKFAKLCEFRRGKVGKTEFRNRIPDVLYAVQPMASGYAVAEMVRDKFGKHQVRRVVAVLGCERDADETARKLLEVGDVSK